MTSKQRLGGVSDDTPRSKGAFDKAEDWDRPFIYRGIKILPIPGKRSPVARAIRDALWRSRRKAGDERERD